IAPLVARRELLSLLMHSRARLADLVFIGRVMHRPLLLLRLVLAARLLIAARMLLLAAARMLLLTAARVLLATTALLLAAAALLLLRLTMPLLAPGVAVLFARLGGWRAGLEAGDRTALDLAVHEPLDRRHQRTVFVAYQRHRLAFGAGAAGAADAVHVVFGDVRHVVVDDVGQGLD